MIKITPRFFLLFIFLTGLLAVQPVGPAHAASIIVNTNADNTNTDGLCTLREAITNANTDTSTYPDCNAGSGSDTITFAGDYTITLSSTLPDISQNAQSLTITGNGTSNTIIQAAASVGTATYRIIKLNGSVTLPTATLENMTFRYGGDVSGAAINVQAGTLTLNNMLITENQIPASGGLNGGGISQNGGTVYINNSTISNNSIGSANNSGNGNGGGIFVNTGSLNISNSTISGNTAYNSGGGIYLKSSSTATISNSTISGNTASNTSETTAGGGGIAQTSGTTTLNNVTISGNNAVSNGGGIYLSGTTLNVNYSTIAGNYADTNNDATGDGGGVHQVGGTFNLTSSIVAGNKKTTSTDNDCGGTITSQGYNLTGSSTGCSLAGTGDVTVTASTVFTAVLDSSIADNGGSTYTYALRSGSSAVNAIPNGTNSCGSGSFANDQRGGTRPQNNNCDMGAYELNLIRNVSTTGTDSGDCSITTCLTLTYAYGKTLGGETINVAAGTYTTS
ncbi:MAG TPA: choice-of-anchor Q domain-containing protein, partial [Anaerolineales bacterium]|nr:choice-of-anchor Q domain-containing protein [Anaerolineales bacterium]